MKFFFPGLVLSALLLLFTQRGLGGEGPTKEDYRPGILLRVFKKGDDTNTLVTRRSRLLAFYNAEGKTPSPLLNPGDYVYRFEGVIDLDFRDYFKFHVTGRGHVRLLIKDEEILKGDLSLTKALVSEEIKLSGKRLNAFSLVLTPPSTGETRLSVRWSSEEIVLEPLPVKVLKHNGKDTRLMADNLKRRGRELFARHRCLNCHQGDVSGMEELKADSPSLAGIGSRVKEDWLVEWIRNPKKLRPSAHMPALLHGAGADQEARDLAAYLMTRKAQGPAPTWKTADAKSLDKGQALYQALGCASCHSFQRAKEGEEDHGRVPQDLIAAKWQPGALKEFLKNPSTHYRWTRMPNFHLSEEEAVALAGYLLKEGKTPVSEAPAGTAAKGKTLFAQKGCAHCHDPKAEKKVSFPALHTLTGKAGGCLEKGAVQFGFSAADQKALKTFLEKGFDSLKRHHPESFAMRQIHSLRCVSCHNFDGRSSIWNIIKEQEGESAVNVHELGKRIGMNHVGDKQDIPSMTWFGEKLKSDWMEAFIAGKITEKPRMGVMARMPHFPVVAQKLTAGLAQSHGLPLRDKTTPKTDPDIVKKGQDIVKTTACSSCHMIAGTQATGGPALQTIDLRYTAKRLRRDFFLRWMNDPLRLEPSTMMPKFNLGREKHEAIWSYLNSLDSK